MILLFVRYRASMKHNRTCQCDGLVTDQRECSFVEVECKRYLAGRCNARCARDQKVEAVIHVDVVV